MCWDLHSESVGISFVSLLPTAFSPWAKLAVLSHIAPNANINYFLISVTKTKYYFYYDYYHYYCRCDAITKRLLVLLKSKSKAFKLGFSLMLINSLQQFLCKFAKSNYLASLFFSVRQPKWIQWAIAATLTRVVFSSKLSTVTEFHFQPPLPNKRSKRCSAAFAGWVASCSGQCASVSRPVIIRTRVCKFRMCLVSTQAFVWRGCAWTNSGQLSGPSS